MLTKLYETIKEYIKKENKFLLILLTLLLIFTVKLPYYIDMPGGIIDISDRIIIDNETKLKGSLNFAYVSETRATIPTIIIAKINKNWDIIKKNEVMQENETEAELIFREKLELKEAVSNALYAGFKAANENFGIENEKIYVTSKYKESNTDLKIGDQILKIDNKEITEKQDLKESIKKEEGEIVEVEVENNNKKYKRTAKLIKIENRVLIGVGIGETYDITSEHNIEINYKAQEYGPSGGMMMALTVYNNLTHQDITKGKMVVGTGTIDKEGNVGEIGGIKYKLAGAIKNKADIFLVPNGENYEEAIKIKNEKKYNIKIIGVSTLKDAINELEKD